MPAHDTILTLFGRELTRPIEKVTYCLNLDMIGRNPERPMDVEGVKNAEGDALERIITAACEAEQLKITKYDHTNEAMFRSDGVSLLQPAPARRPVAMMSRTAAVGTTTAGAIPRSPAKRRQLQRPNAKPAGNARLAAVAAL